MNRRPTGLILCYTIDSDHPRVDAARQLTGIAALLPHRRFMSQAGAGLTSGPPILRLAAPEGRADQSERAAGTHTLWRGHA
jgi:hypothetical protein